LKAAGIGALAFLFLNGIQAVSDPLATAGRVPEHPITFDTGSKTQALIEELARLQAVGSIENLIRSGVPDVPDDFRNRLAASIYEASSLFGVNAELLLAVIEVESSFRVDARSHRGAVGLMQLMPRTGEALSIEMQLEGFSRQHLRDVRTNILLGTYYLKKLLDRYGRLDYALTAYNMGETRFDLAMTEQRSLSFGYAALVQKKMRKLARLQEQPVEQVE
jgi:soluble lytic murein transglycosylase-like protein